MATRIGASCRGRAVPPESGPPSESDPVTVRARDRPCPRHRQRTTRSSTTSSSTWVSSGPSRSSTATTPSRPTRPPPSSPTPSSSARGPAGPRMPGMSTSIIRWAAGRHPGPRRLPRPPVHRCRLGRQRDPARRRSCTARPPGSTHEGAGRVRRASLTVRGDPATTRCWSNVRRSPRSSRSPPPPRTASSWGCGTRDLDVEGVQFHPESILTASGHDLLANFLARVP